MRWVLAVPLVALAGFGLSAMDGSSALRLLVSPERIGRRVCTRRR
jgi:hypothetical protein